MKAKTPLSKTITRMMVGFAGLIILLMIIAFIVLRLALGAWATQLNIMIATDDSIAAFGDGAHNVPITPEAALSVGQSAVINELRVTVTKTGEVEDTTGLPITAKGYLFWRVIYSVENVSKKEVYPHPSVQAQIQYEPYGDGFIRLIKGEGDCVPSIKKSRPALSPNARFVCDMIYEVPRGNQPLYWVFLDDDENAVFRLR